MKKGLILILTLGVFSIINTEMGVVGILPLISEKLRSDGCDGGAAGQYVCTGRCSVRSDYAPFLFRNQQEESNDTCSECIYGM